MVIVNGKKFEMDVVEHYMDNGIMEELHKDCNACESEQAFVDAYVKAHSEKFDGEIFDIN